MKTFHLRKDIARLAILQRSELLNQNLKKIRKIFGRYLFTNFFSKHFINIQEISESYYKVMSDELMSIKKYLKSGQKILCIGSGIGGLEILIQKYFNEINFTFIEKDYVSKKVIYGWDNNNSEAYNSINLLEKFLTDNKMKKSDFSIVDFDKNKLPVKKFDIVISLYSLDYHYDIKFYIDYLKKICTKDTLLIFDTIRAEYFNEVFEHVDVIKVENKIVHKSKRIVCKNFLNY